MTFAETETDIDALIGLQRGAYEDASKLQKWSFWLNLSIAGAGIVTVFVGDSHIALGATLIAFLLFLLTVFLSWRHRGLRGFAERVRKATLLSKGLGHSLSNKERRSIRAAYPGDEERAKALVDRNYYASKANPSPRRLAEMLEESAFWSEYLLRRCSVITWLRFVGFVAATIVIFAGVAGYYSGGGMADAVRVLLAVLSVLISREFFGAAMAYTVAASTASSIVERLQSLQSDDDILPDLMLILGDYNSAVESAPLFLPGVYEKHEKKLNALWDQYQRK